MAVESFSPLAYWRFEEAAGESVASDEENLADGVYSGSVTLGQSGFDGTGNCAGFSGDDWVEIDHDAAFMLDEGTISLWFKADDCTPFGSLLSKDSSGYDNGGHLSIYIGYERVNMYLASRTSGVTIRSSSGSVRDGEWHHVVASFGPAGMVLYLDGVEVDSSTYTGGLGLSSGGTGNDEPLTFGSSQARSGNGTVHPLYSPLRGSIDELVIFGSEFDLSDTNTLYSAGTNSFIDVSVASGFNLDTDGGLHDGSGLVWADLDNDGDVDCVVGGRSSRIMWNTIADGTFTSTNTGSLERLAALIDLDRDGDFDIATCNNDPVVILENQNGSLVSSGALGFGSPTNAEGAVSADVDGDGDTDLVVFGENGNWIAINKGAGFEGHSPVGFEDDNDPSDGLNDPGDYGNGDYVSSADVNDDGFLDFFYHYGSGKLFLSNGDGTFTENASGISTYTNNNYKFGSAWGDYDNDGDMDLFTPDARSGQPGKLWRNNGGSFSNVASAAGITSTSAMRSSCWGDYDNDGDLDLYVATDDAGPNLLYTNDGDGTFTLEDLGAGLTGGHEDVCFIDFDNDGDLDLSLTTREGDGKTRLLENQTNDTNFLMVRPVGPEAGGVNRGIIGARVELFSAGGAALLGRREIGVARGYGGSEPIWAHFGGVDPAQTYVVRITFPGGGRVESTIVPQNASTTIGGRTVSQMLTVEQPKSLRVVNWSTVAPID